MTAVNSGRRAQAVAAAGCAALFGFAFIAAPHSCEWGLEAYFWSGVAWLAIAFALPFALQRASTVGRRIAWGFAYATLAGATWFAGLAAANVRIICRLF